LGNAISLPLNFRFRNAVFSYLIYLVKGIWPSGLAVFYPHPEGRLGTAKVLLAVAVIALISALIWINRQKRYLTVGWLWFLGTFIPVIGIVQVGRQAMADRYAYLPFIGLFVGATWLIADSTLARKISRPVLTAAALSLIFVYASVSYRQITYWRNSYTLFAHTLEVTSGNAIAEDNIGEALVQMGHPKAAIPHFQAAILIAPELPTPHYNLGTLLHMEDKLDDARREYEIALSRSSDPIELTRAHNNLGALFLRLKQPAQAIEQFDAALRITPGEINSLIGRGTVEYQQGSLDLALGDFTYAAHIGPSPVAHFWAGRVLEDSGKLAEAAAAYDSALALAPGLQEARVRREALRSRLP
jgi:Tfp pilus assembly protein PilF